MIILVRFLLAAIFAAVIFLRPYFPNDLLYWSMYVVLFALVYAFWHLSFFVSRKKASGFLGKEPECDIFCGKVPLNEMEDLQRGRLCATEGKLILVGKDQKGKLCKTEEILISDITSVGFGYVVGRRKGFTVHCGKKSVSFTSAKAAKNKAIIYKMLGWEEVESK